MLQNDLFYKVIDMNTIMVFKATPRTGRCSRTRSSRRTTCPMRIPTSCGNPHDHQPSLQGIHRQADQRDHREGQATGTLHRGSGDPRRRARRVHPRRAPADPPRSARASASPGRCASSRSGRTRSPAGPAGSTPRSRRSRRSARATCWSSPPAASATPGRSATSSPAGPSSAVRRASSPTARSVTRRRSPPSSSRCTRRPIHPAPLGRHHVPWEVDVGDRLRRRAGRARRPDRRRRRRRGGPPATTSPTSWRPRSCRSARSASSSSRSRRARRSKACTR